MADGCTTISRLSSHGVPTFAPLDCAPPENSHRGNGCGFRVRLRLEFRVRIRLRLESGANVRGALVLHSPRTHRTILPSFFVVIAKAPTTLPPRP